VAFISELSLKNLEDRTNNKETKMNVFCRLNRVRGHIAKRPQTD
jgi:hypothetical protein